MSAGEKRIVGCDKSEMARLRRALRRLSHQAFKDVVRVVLDGTDHHELSVDDPDWETGVFPLYYSFYEPNKPAELVYRDIFRSSLPSTPPEDLYDHLKTVANTEIDLLIEDTCYFIFLEAKVGLPGQGSARFSMADGVHQLVRQFVQGRFLERKIQKTFVLATIGANNSEILHIEVKDTAQRLLRVVDFNESLLSIHDFPWNILPPSD